MDNQAISEAINRYSASEVGRKIERLFIEILRELLPKATLVTEKSSISLQPDIMAEDGDRVLFFEVKASTERGVLPPSGFSEMVQQLQRYHYRFDVDRDSWVLLTSYRIPESMEEYFLEQSLHVFQFELSETVGAVKRRLAAKLEQLRYEQAGG